MRLPSATGGPTTTEVGFFECDVDVFAEWLEHGLEGGWRRRHPAWPSLEAALKELQPSVPLGRYACVPSGSWTVLLSNGPTGTDVGMLPRYAARELNCRAVRAVSSADGPNQYAARVLAVYGPAGTSPSGLERSIVAANDGGKWVFEVAGEPFAFEDLTAYENRAKAKRFDTRLLYEYLSALGVPTDSEPIWSEAVVVEKR